MAVPLSWSTSLGEKVTLSPDESQLSPCKKQSLNTGGPPAHLSFLGVSSYATSKSPLPPSWASSLPHRAGSRHATGSPGLPPIEEEEDSGGRAWAALPSTAVTTRLCEYCTHRWWVSLPDNTWEETSSPVLQTRSMESPAGPMLCCAQGARGLRASQYHVFLLLQSNTARFTNASSPYLLPTSLRNRSQTCLCHWRCVNKTNLWLPQRPQLSNALH